MKAANFLAISAICSGILLSQPRDPIETKLPPKSGFYISPDSDLTGVGNISKITCTIGQATQPGIFAGNMLIDCDGEIPHNETTITVNPGNPNHAAGGYHSYQLAFVGATAKVRVVGTVSVTRDGGATWTEVIPPVTPYQFTGDPALAFNANGRLYFANIADHEGPGGPFTAPSVVVARSDDGGATWSNPVTVASGFGSVTPGRIAPLVFQDKEFITVDTGASPFRNRVYVTWTSFQESPRGPAVHFRSPIMASFSNDGVQWSQAREISGSHPACSAHLPGGTGCDLNQFSVPTVAPGGRTYVGFENFNTPAENQYLVVSSSDGGATWNGPSRVDSIFDINLPQNVDGRDTLTGCQFRVIGPGNVAADPSDPSGNTVYAVWADNRNGSEVATNMDVFLARSVDGGNTWALHTLDTTANDQFYPWVAVAPNGRVDVGYMDRSYSADQTVCQYGFTLTRVTFDASGIMTSKTKARVDTGLSDPGQSRWFSSITNGNSLFIGDYNGVAVAGDGSTYSLWTDQRNVVANPPSPTRNHGQHAVGGRTP